MADLVLEDLGAVRAEIASIGVEIEALRDKMCRGFSTLSQRLDGIETEVRGMNYMATVAIGSVLVDIKDLKERVTCLENP